MADKEVVNFYGKWVQLLAEHEKTIVVKHWDGFQFLCMHLPNGVVGGVEEHLVRLIKRYISQPSSFTPGQLTGEVNQIISLISQKLFLHQGQKVPVDARGFYNETIAPNSPQQVPNPIKSEVDASSLQKIVEEEERKKKMEQEKKDEELARQLMREERGDYEEEGDDQEDEEAGKIPCKYGRSCYRKNPDHLRQYSHPPKYQPTSTAPAPYKSYNANNGSEELTDEDEDRSIDDSHEEASEEEEFYPGSQDNSFDAEAPLNARNNFSSDFVSGFVPGASNLFSHQAKAALQSVQAIFPFAPQDIIATVLQSCNNDVSAACDRIADMGL